MDIKLKPIIHEFNNCFQGQVETIVEEYYHKNYLLTQLYRWTTFFDIIDGKLDIGGDIELNNGDELELLGLKQVNVQCNNKHELLKSIKEELDDNVPVIVAIQITNCPWDPNYQKEFIMLHSIIIIGYDDDKEYFRCCDATYNVQGGCLSFDDFLKGCSNEYQKIVEVDKKKCLSGSDLEYLLKCQAEKLLSGRDTHFQKLRKIGNYLIENANDIDINEEHLDNVLFSKTYMIIRDCAKTREMMVHILNDYGKQNKQNLMELFSLSMKKWLRIRILYVRVATTDLTCVDLKNIGKRLHEIETLEKKIAEYIISNDKSCVVDYLQDVRTAQMGVNYADNEKILKENVIDLYPYFNNKAFGDYDDNETAMFSELGEYMLTPSEKITILLNGHRKIHMDIPVGFDNIVCLNQNIPVNLKDVVEIYLIGNSEYSSDSESMILDLDDGTQMCLPLDFPEWYTEIISDEIMVLKQKVIAREDNHVMITSFFGKIFMKKYIIKKSSIVNIRLPEAGRIHLFHMIACTY